MTVKLLLKMSSVEANTQQVDEGAGETRVNLIKFKYKWTISNFSLYEMKKGEILVSPTFSMGSRDEYKWQLNVYFETQTSNSSDTQYLSVYLQYLERDKKPKCQTKSIFYISNDNNKVATLPKPIKEYTLEHTFTKLHFMKLIASIERNFLLDPVNCLLSDDRLMLVCDITIRNIISENTYSKCPEAPKCRLPDDLNDLFESSKLYDVTLIACGKEFRAHKAILAARSSVFSAMFEHEMKEGKENRVEITDVDDEVLSEMLRFMYTGKSTNLDKMAESLLVAADKYELESLKTLCTKKLWENVSNENAANLLIVADLYRAVNLKAHVQKFISTHKEVVSKTESFKNVCKTHPHLIIESLAIAD